MLCLILVIICYSTCCDGSYKEVSSIEKVYQEFLEDEVDESDLTVDDMEDFMEENTHRGKRSAFYRSGKEVALQVSDTLDILLVKQGYNKQMRPDDGGKPVEVELNMAVRTIGPIDETKEVFSLDCYFRQSWFDPRLKFNTSGINQLALNWKFLTKIWKPDTVFLNGQRCSLHKMTVPNRFIRVYPDGKVSYSQRLTLWARCAMYLGKYPFDSQSCPLEIGSFGYTAQDVTYKWSSSPLSMDEVEMSQYKLTSWDFGVREQKSDRKIASGLRTDSVAFLLFNFERQSGFWLLGIYFPLTLIVMCSWVAFWIVKTDVPARIALGVTTVLSVTKIGFGGKAKPQVGYSTALDIYIIICFFYTFAALTEFAVINFITIFVQRYKKQEEEIKEKKEKLKTAADILDSLTLTDNGNKTEDREEKSNEKDILCQLGDIKMKVEYSNEKKEIQEKLNEESEEDNDDKTPKVSILDYVLSKAREVETRLGGWRPHLPGIPTLLYEETQYVVDRLDEISRMVFPTSFIFTSLGYWIYYFHIAEDVE